MLNEICKYRKIKWWRLLLFIGFLMPFVSSQGQSMSVELGRSLRYEGGFVNYWVFVENPKKAEMSNLRILYRRLNEQEYDSTNTLRGNPYKKQVKGYLIRLNIGTVAKKEWSTIQERIEILLVYENSNQQLDTLKTIETYEIQHLEDLGMRIFRPSKEKIELYEGIQTRLKVTCEKLGDNFRPSMGVIGGSRIMGKDRGLFSVVPSENKDTLTITISSSGKFIGLRKYPIKKVPPPKIVFKSNGKSFELKNGINAAVDSVFSIELIPNEEIVKLFPGQFNYNVSGILYLMKDDFILEQVGFSNGEIDFNRFRMKPNKDCYFRLLTTQIKRKNRSRSYVSELTEWMYDIPIH